MQVHFDCTLGARTAFAAVGLALALAGCGDTSSAPPTVSNPPVGASPLVVPGPSPVSGRPGNAYRQVNLVSDIPGLVPATDPDLVNPWGIALDTTGFLWVMDHGNGLVTIYDSSGARLDKGTISGLGGYPARGTPTGITLNTATNRDLSINGYGQSGAPGVGIKFLVADEEGAISGIALSTIVADRSSTGAVYKGVAIATIGSANFLYAANVHAGVVDVFDGKAQFTHSFTDPGVPAGFAPFGIQNIGGNLLVSFALRTGPGNHDDLPGPGNGFVDVFSPGGTLLRRLVSNGPLNSPWGMALAPSGFGAATGTLLVGNNGDGRINSFDLNTGAFLGALQDSSGSPIAIEGLWGLAFGNGAGGAQTNYLYFTAGTGGRLHGLLGRLELAEAPARRAG